MTSKAEVNLLRDLGRALEVFSHERGHFNVTELRARIEHNEVPYTKCACLFADLQMVDGVKTDAFEYLVANREIDEARVAALTERELAEPLIALDCEDGSQLIVDGIHRLVRLKRDGAKEFRFHLVPEKFAPRVDMAKQKELHWGTKKFENGKLIERGQPQTGKIERTKQ